MNNLVERLRETVISASPEFPVHPNICTEAADYIKKLEKELERTQQRLYNLQNPYGPSIE